jgi:hypothetical protein
MSTFKLYTSKNSNAKILGKRSKITFRTILFLLPVAGLIIGLINKIFQYQINSLFLLLYIGLIIITVGYSIFLIFNIKQIGTISFDKNYITKQIGDFSEQYSYSSIFGFVIKTHVRDFLYQRDKFGIRSYYLEIQFKDNTSQRLVISGDSTNNLNHNLMDILATVSEINNIKLDKF